MSPPVRGRAGCILGRSKVKIGAYRPVSSAAGSLPWAGRPAPSAAGDHESVPARRLTCMNTRGRVLVLFRSGLGLVFLAAFLSLAAQLRDLAGTRGLLPWVDFLARMHPVQEGWMDRLLSFPTLFLWIQDDAALTIVPLLGAAISILLVLGIGGRAVPLVLW